MQRGFPLKNLDSWKSTEQIIPRNVIYAYRFERNLMKANLHMAFQLLGYKQIKENEEKKIEIESGYIDFIFRKKGFPTSSTKCYI